MACYHCCECQEYKNTDTDMYFDCPQHEDGGMCQSCWEELGEVMEEREKAILKPAAELFPHIDYSGLPEHMQDGMKLYIEDRIPPGSFLTAVLENDLKEAFSCADDINTHRMRDYIVFLYNKAPCSCWGSPEKFTAWLKGGE